ncbi:carbonic anhydrase [Humidesulfovibrio idahonensis]
MKRFLAVVVLALSLCAQAFASSAGPTMPADEAMKMLKDGNARYAGGASTYPHQGADRRAETAKGGQHPVATIIGCSDSRAPLEVVFDQGVGDIFVIRVAGNLAGPDELGSIEYGVGHLGTPVVLVLGHTSCGAVTAAVQNAKVHGNIPTLINQIKPAVAKARSWTPTATGDDLLNKSIKANVWLTMENILRKSVEVREFVKNGQVLLVGGIYDLTTGKVEWLGQHPEQGKILATAHIVHKPKPKPKPKPKAEGDAAEEQGDAKHDADAKAESKADAKIEAKVNGKGAKAGAKAKTGAKAEAKDEINPNAHSDGGGELLAPEVDPPVKPAKTKHK